MGVGEMPQHPLTPYDVIRAGLKLEILQAGTVERAHTLVAAQVLARLLQEMLVLFHQIDFLKMPRQQVFSYSPDSCEQKVRFSATGEISKFVLHSALIGRGWGV